MPIGVKYCACKCEFAEVEFQANVSIPLLLEYIHILTLIGFLPYSVNFHIITHMYSSGGCFIQGDIMFYTLWCDNMLNVITWHLFNLSFPTRVKSTN